VNKETEQKKRKEYISQLSKILEHTDKAPNKEQIEKLKVFGEYLTHEYAGIKFFALSELLNEDMGIALKLLDTIRDFCVDNKIPFSTALNTLMIFSIYQLNSVNKHFIEEENKILNLSSNNIEDMNIHLEGMVATQELRKNIRDVVENESDFYTSMSNRFTKICEYGKSLPITDVDKIVYQTVLYDSYETAKKQVFKNVTEANLPLSKYNLKPMGAVRELSEESEIFGDIFSSQSTLGQMNTDNHFFKHILQDKMEATNNGKVIFKGHTESLIMGHTQKAISLSLDKKKALAELNKGLIVLRKYNKEGTAQLIKTTETLMVVIEQRKYSNMITYKAMSKEMGITLKQAKQYAKELSTFYSIHSNTFDKHFDNLKVYDVKDYTS